MLLIQNAAVPAREALARKWTIRSGAARGLRCATALSR